MAQIAPAGRPAVSSLDRNAIMPAFLFIVSILTWSTTWYPLKVAVGVAPVPTTMLWRFLIAGAISMVILVFSGQFRFPRRAEWLWLTLLGFFIFSMNFLAFGQVSRMIPSGMVSVLFATATIFNAINARLFFHEPVTARMAAAIGLGLVGLILMFAPDLARDLRASGAGTTWAAIAIGLCGALLFSLGNMVSRRSSASGMGLIWANGWGMCIGSVILTIATLASGADLLPPARVDWWASVLFLAVIGSVLGFAAYLGLVARVGPSRAAYTTVLFPVVALWISWAVEGYEWHLPAIIGLVLITAGNVLIFTRAGMRRPVQAG